MRLNLVAAGRSIQVGAQSTDLGEQERDEIVQALFQADGFEDHLALTGVLQQRMYILARLNATWISHVLWQGPQTC